MVDHTGVEDYLTALPEESRAALERLRKLIRAAAPDATEAISYGMPAFRYHGRFLVSYAGWAKHCAFYPLTGQTTAAHAAALAGFDVAKGTIRFTPPQRLPDELLAAIVAERRAAIDGEAERG